jgi:hypothetical protein
VSRDNGYWIAGAEDAKYVYDGPVGDELCFKLEVSVPTFKASDVHEQMQDTICKQAVRYDIATNWVHVTALEVEVLHFSIEALTA